jgi:hypothetical protein
VLEGGYALGALARSVAVTLDGLSAAPIAAGATGPAPLTPAAGRALERLAEWWPGLTRR